MIKVKTFYSDPSYGGPKLLFVWNLWKAQLLVAWNLWKDGSKAQAIYFSNLDFL